MMPCACLLFAVYLVPGRNLASGTWAISCFRGFLKPLTWLWWSPVGEATGQFLPRFILLGIKSETVDFGPEGQDSNTCAFLAAEALPTRGFRADGLGSHSGGWLALPGIIPGSDWGQGTASLKLGQG